MPESKQVARSVTFSEDEFDRLEKLSQDMGESVHSLMKYAVLYMLEYQDNPKKFTFNYKKSLGEP